MWITDLKCVEGDYGSFAQNKKKIGFLAELHKATWSISSPPAINLHFPLL